MFEEMSTEKKAKIMRLSTFYLELLLGMASFGQYFSFSAQNTNKTRGSPHLNYRR